MPTQAGAHTRRTSARRSRSAAWRALNAVTLAGLFAPALTLAADTDQVYIEYLWSKTPEGALARQETRTFALDGRFDHQVCVAILDDAQKVSSLDITLLDGSGQSVSSRSYPRTDGRKRCYSADLPATATAGKWTYQVRVNGEPRVLGERTIDVYTDVEALVKTIPSDMPYVLGRPNYDPSIPPETYDGELIWIMHIRPDGTVSDVEIEKAEGIGEVMRDKALAAGALSLFPPDPARSADARFRRHLALRPQN